ncbi:MAG: hypothetical protein O9320_16060 [Magnetospirillum sp.]|nr:hypothetical protein [Magnetospirillum sp.]
MSIATPVSVSVEGKELTAFLDQLCCDNDDTSFVFKLAGVNTRWTSVSDLLSDQQKELFDRIAFRPQRRGDGFSPGSLKAHYVLDEDFINSGSAIVIFSLVGTQWTHVVHVQGQNLFAPAERWLESQ